MKNLSANEEAACFIRYVDSQPIAFAQRQLLQDYIEDAESSPGRIIRKPYLWPKDSDGKLMPRP